MGKDGVGVLRIAGGRRTPFKQPSPCNEMPGSRQSDQTSSRWLRGIWGVEADQGLADTLAKFSTLTEWRVLFPIPLKSFQWKRDLSGFPPLETGGLRSS